MKKLKIYSVLFCGAAMLLLQHDLHSLQQVSQSNEGCPHMYSIENPHQESNVAAPFACDLSLRQKENIVSRFNKLADQLDLNYWKDISVSALNLCGKLSQLSNNDRNKLLQIVCQMTWLTELNLADNQLVELPNGIGKLTNLKCLNLARNQLAVLPKEIEQFKMLREIDLEGNKLTLLPNTIISLMDGHLTQLFLRSNPLLKNSSRKDFVGLDKLKSHIESLWDPDLKQYYVNVYLDRPVATN